MKEKRPQPTDVLIKRLRRVAGRIDRYLKEDWAGTGDEAQWRARANTCWQAAARLEEQADRIEELQDEAGGVWEISDKGTRRLR